MDPEIKALFETMIEGQRQTDRIVGNLATVVGDVATVVGNLTTVVENNANATREAINSLGGTVDRYVQAADARMRRIEENLDGLIRAITREHSNGKHGKD
jgi:hypothetical protein